jgi:hypothetical protein
MIVGVLGFIGSGKGTVGDILKDTLGFRKASFAGHLKDVAALMFGWPRNLLEGDTKESREFRELTDKYWSQKMGRDFSPRIAMQLLGTEIGRNFFSENFWIDCLEKQIKKDKGNYVITDVRFKNEIEWVTKQGGILIEVRRNTTPHWYDIASKANRGSEAAERYMLDSGVHQSEWRWIGRDVDFTIDNEGTLEDLREKVLTCLKTCYGISIIEDMLQQQGVYNETV